MGAVVPIRPELNEERQAEPASSAPKRRSTKGDTHVAFTPARLKALTKAKQSGYFYDTKTPGLAVRLGKSKSVYVHAYRDNGAYVRRTLGNIGTISIGDARLAVAAAAGALARDGALPTPRQARKAAGEARVAERKRVAFTLEAAFGAYLAAHELMPNTLMSYRSVWRHVPVALKSTPLADLDGPSVAGLHRKIGQRHKRTANKLVVLIAAICKASGRRFDNPASDIKLYRETPRSRRLTPDETMRLRAVLDTERRSENDSRAMLAVFVSIALMTGARRSSIAAMRWADLDLRAGKAVWIVPARWSKNGVELAIAVTDEAAAVLAVWRERCPASAWVFPSPEAASGHLAEPRKGWERIRKAAGIADATLHDLRRSLGSEVAAAGGNAATIAGVLGHMSLQSAKSYLHLNTVEVRRALEKLRDA